MMLSASESSSLSVILILMIVQKLLRLELSSASPSSVSLIACLPVEPMKLSTTQLLSSVGFSLSCPETKFSIGNIAICY